MSTEINVLDIVALTEDLPRRGLYRGQVGTVVEVLAPGVLEVEFSDDQGRTQATLALPSAQLEGVTLKYQEDDAPSAFVLMPFDAEFTDVYKDFIKPALEAEGYEVRRADTELDQENILRTIVHCIDGADLIVAELTSSNPNVFYELGIAHGLQKPVVLLSQDLSEVPFDLRSYRIITYSSDYREVRELENQLREIARRHRGRTVVFGSPVKDFAPSAVGSFNTAITGTTSAEEVLATSLEQADEPQVGEQGETGAFDFICEVEQAIEQITDYADGFIAAMEQYGQKLQVQAAEMKTIDSGGPKGRAARLRRIFRAMASEATRFAEDVESELPGFREAWESLGENFAKYISAARAVGASNEKAETELRPRLEEFGEVIAEVSEKLRTVRDEIAANRGVSKDLDLAVKKTVNALDNLIEELVAGESYVFRMINVLDEQAAEA